MKNRMNIAISLNQNYFRYTYVMLWNADNVHLDIV